MIRPWTPVKKVFIDEYVGLSTRLEALAMGFLISEYYGHQVCLDWAELDSFRVIGAQVEKCRPWDRPGRSSWAGFIASAASPSMRSASTPAARPSSSWPSPGPPLGIRSINSNKNSELHEFSTGLPQPVESSPGAVRGLSHEDDTAARFVRLSPA